MITEHALLYEPPKSKKFPEFQEKTFGHIEKILDYMLRFSIF